ncbi:penicillin-binding transpeptidase domain-containing protein [Streptomyces sp. NPDC020141]|uniref:penicillin-binding transpeptidase domain-containing protein n=1 Tax=Streptomyces sp. NPDC020141 TaxID=3365065 RepID=UPI003797BE62
MPLPLRRPALVLTTLLTVFAVCVSAGCAAETRDTDDARPKPSGKTGASADTGPPAPKPDGSPGDLLVAGRPITGWQPTGIPKAPFERTYTDGELYASVTGYRSTAFGATGLDAVVREDIEAGKDVATTIDPAIQRAAFDGLRGREGAAVALDAKTGDILGLVSAPSFDPASFSGNSTADVKAWDRLQEGGTDGPLRNRALRSADNPGTAAHVLVAAAALEKGLLASVDTPTRSPADHTVPGSATEFSGDPAHCADASLREALRHSCANVFARVASDLGAGALASTAEAFGFGQDSMRTPVPALESVWPGEAENPAQLALLANGLFEVKATPVQMAMVMAVLANGGHRVRPHLVADPVPPRRAVSQHTADQLRSALDAPVGAWVPSASVAWALSFTRTPAGRPLAVAVSLDSPADATSQAAAVARQITEADKG